MEGSCRKIRQEENKTTSKLFESRLYIENKKNMVFQSRLCIDESFTILRF